MTKHCLALAIALAVLSGCQSMNDYADAKRYQASGGAQRDIAAAEQRQSQELTRNRQLDAQARQRQREIEDNERRIAATRRELDETNQRLALALRDKKVSAARHAELKKQLDALRSEAATLQKQVETDKQANHDASPDPAKLKKLQALEARKKEIEQALAIAVAR